MGLGGNILQYGLYIFNGLVFVVGAALVVIGSLFLTIFKHDFHFIRFSVTFVAIAFIAIGSVLILLVVLGIMVTRQSNSKLAVGHLFGLILAFAALATLGIWGLTIVFNDDVHNQIKAELNDTISHYNQTNPANENTQEMNWAQQKLHCCGIGSYEDWGPFIEEDLKINPERLVNAKSRNQSAIDVPDSCCRNETVGCGAQYPELDKIYTDGCFEPLKQFITDDLKILCGIACGLAGLTLISIAFLLFVCYTTKGDYSELAQQ